MNKKEITDALTAFPYDRAEYWIITGGAMVMYGIREKTHDIDLGCTPKLADRLEADGYLTERGEDGRRSFRYGDSVEIFEGWLRDSVVRVDGFPVISLRGLVQMKTELGRAKDLRDIELIKAFLGAGGGSSLPLGEEIKGE